MSLRDLTAHINTLAEDPLTATTISTSERQNLLRALHSLSAAIETPEDAAIRICLGAFDQIAVRIGIDMGIFDAMSTTEEEMDVKELSSRIGKNELLVTRVMRVLGAMGLFTALPGGGRKYVKGRLADAFVEGSPMADYVLHMTTASEASILLPTYLSKTGYRNPDNAYNGPWQFAKDTQLNYFEWLRTQPCQAAAFNRLMSIKRNEVGDAWFEYFPVLERLHAHDDCERVLLVDVGGGVGHDLSAFHAKFPFLKGRLILEDLPHVLSSIPSNFSSPSIELVPHDFFTPQPTHTKGARFYYLSTVLHDWPDKEARQILSHLRDAMSEDSVLLIDDNTMPEEDVPLVSAKLDLHMMALFSGLDRTEEGFGELIESVGLRLVGVHRPKVMLHRTGVLLEVVVGK